MLKSHRQGLFLQFLAFFLTTVFAWGCASRNVVTDLSKWTARDVSQRVARNFARLRTLEGRARVIIEVPGEGYNGFAKAYINKPDSIYVKTEAILGIDIGDFFKDHRYFAAYAPRDNKLYYGEIEALDLRDFLQVEVEADEMIEIFSGLVQVKVNASSKLALQDGDIELTTQVGDGHYVYRIDPEHFVVKIAELIDLSGETVLVTECRRFRRKSGVSMPQTIRMTHPQARERLTVYYTEQRLNKRLNRESFRIKTAKNAERVYLGTRPSSPNDGN